MANLFGYFVDGFSVSEAILLSWDRVDEESRTIHLRAQDTKIRKKRTFPFNNKLAALFVELKAEAKAMGLNSKYVFPSLVSDKDEPMSFSEFRTLWEATCKKANLPEGSRFHWLRHTGLTKAFKRARLDAARICHFAGLSLDEADRTYLHFKPEDLRGVETLVEVL